MKHPGAVLIFAKAPVVGQVKTRLIPALGEIAATRLYRNLLFRLVRMLQGQPVFTFELWCSPDTTHPDFVALQQTSCMPVYRQQGNDLGQRMAHAVKHALQHHPSVILIGVDCPALTLSMIEQAFHWLEEGADAVIGPAEDGGYVLLGLNQSTDCLFDGIPWGSAKVCEMTRQCLEKMAWNWRELPKLWDLDRPEDLHRLDEVGLTLEALK